MSAEAREAHDIVRVMILWQPTARVPVLRRLQAVPGAT